MKKTLLYICLFILFFSATTSRTFAQGCVAIRSVGGTCNLNGSSGNLQKGQWQVSSSFRYFKSYKHFVGTKEQPQRVELGNNVINHSSSLDITLTYAFSQRLNLNINLPLVYNDRSQFNKTLQQRTHTQSKGLGDIRVSANYWLFDFEKAKKGNLSVGLGIKSNSGNYNYKDEFMAVGKNGESEVRPVDQSIQPGDGGWGITVEIQGYRKLSNKLYGFGNFYYLVNPRETNGTETKRSRANEAIMSVPDQYMARLGVTYSTPLTGLSASLAGRLEGIPVHDLVGGSLGFRRPGYVESVEPGITYMRGRLNLNFTVPIAIVRNRTQSVADKDTEQTTGVPTQGDAAFADYSLNLGFTYRLQKTTH